MVVISFSKLKHYILDGSKTQTIRKYSEHWAKLKPGDSLHLYWNLRTKESEALGVGIVRYVYGPITFDEFSEEIARDDGFNNLNEMILCFLDMYGKKAAEQKYIVIVWDYK